MSNMLSFSCDVDYSP